RPLWVRPGLVLVPVAKSIFSLACPLSRLIFLLNRLLCGDSIVVPERIAFPGHVNLCQSLAGSDGQLAVEQVVRVLLDRPVRSVFFGEDVS
ncbi:Protein kinase superfamily protein, partial [Prunus dulcis]